MISSFSIPQLCNQLALLMSRLFTILTSAGYGPQIVDELLRLILYGVLHLRASWHVDLEIRLVNDGAS